MSCPCPGSIPLSVILKKLLLPGIRCAALTGTEGRFKFAQLPQGVCANAPELNKHIRAKRFERRNNLLTFPEKDAFMILTSSSVLMVFNRHFSFGFPNTCISSDMVSVLLPMRPAVEDIDLRNVAKSCYCDTAKRDSDFCQGISPLFSGGMA